MFDCQTELIISPHNDVCATKSAIDHMLSVNAAECYFNRDIYVQLFIT